ncbi:MAG: thiol:disulfide interchange protein DsbA/DsbL [Hydrogenophaga sp.]|jgi:protein dithiol oxidoreductase (disulfide-forming)|nr:thiol:disulfide interchange protein DsbA/DsbL [Hydrogenophaga sp.]
MLNRREWVLALTATCVLSAAGASTPDEGFDYQVFQPPAPRMGAQGLEVLEFFRYGCPFCDRFEPMVHRWQKTLPADVRFHYVPVSFQSTSHQQLYLTLRQLGQVERLHQAVYDAIHRQGQHFEILMEISQWVQQRGVDPVAFEAAWHSRAVAQAMVQANDLVRAYGVTSVPQLGVAGRYRTSPAMVGGSNERALVVVDHLIDLARVTPVV